MSDTNNVGHKTKDEVNKQDSSSTSFWLLSDVFSGPPWPGLVLRLLPNQEKVACSKIGEGKLRVRQTTSARNRHCAEN